MILYFLSGLSGLERHSRNNGIKSECNRHKQIILVQDSYHVFDFSSIDKELQLGLDVLHGREMALELEPLAGRDLQRNSSDLRRNFRRFCQSEK